MVDNILCLSHLDSKDRFENKTDFECTEVIENLLRQLKPVCGEIKLNFHTDNKKFIITGNPEMFGQNAVITATSEDGGFKSVCLVNVTAPDAKAEGVQLDKHSLSIPAGGAASLNVTFIPIYASNQNVTWSF